LYFTDRGIEELSERRGNEQVALGWLAERLRDFIDEHPDSEATVDRLASWLARLVDDDYDE
jgi:DNA-binding transcriptional LysR family regulator